MNKLAVQIGKRQLKDAKYVEKLAQMMDESDSGAAEEVAGELGENEEGRQEKRKK